MLVSTTNKVFTSVDALNSYDYGFKYRIDLMAPDSRWHLLDAATSENNPTASSVQQAPKRKASSNLTTGASLVLKKREKGSEITTAGVFETSTSSDTGKAEEGMGKTAGASKGAAITASKLEDAEKSMEVIQCDLLAQEPKGRPLAEPPIFRYNLFEGFETLQKEAKNSPAVSRTELAWITGYVDLQSEIDLFYQYENSIWGTIRENASEGLDSDNDFLIGLAREIWEDAKNVQEERTELEKRHGKSWEEVLELHCLVRYGRDEEGNVKWPWTEEIGLEEWLKGYDGWGFREGRKLIKVRLGIKGMIFP